MRISDWSSDVCSSDLGWLRCTIDVDNGAAQRVITFYTSTDGIVWTTLSTHTVAGATAIFDSTAAVTIGVRETTTNPAHGKFGRQIGRASCRERVCQSV